MTQHTPQQEDDTNLARQKEEIQELIIEARELAFRLSEEEEPIHETWEELCQIITSCRLGELTRHPKLEQVYTKRFNPLVKESYGSVVEYLRLQLGFSKEEGQGGGGGGAWKWREEGSEERVRKNDWKYSIPNEVEHYVVWVNRPLFHKDLCTTSSSDDDDDDDDETLTPLSTETKIDATGAATQEKVELDRNSWEFVKEYGLSGISTESIKQSENKSFRGDKDDSRKEVESTLRRRRRDPRKYVREFVENEWPVSKGWECAWFANPPSLQSVRGLAHFHVMVRRRPGWVGSNGGQREEGRGERGGDEESDGRKGEGED